MPRPGDLTPEQAAAEGRRLRDRWRRPIASPLLPKPTPSRTRRKPTLRGCRSTPRLACTEQLMLKTY
jgi:hypothetical protein